MEFDQSLDLKTDTWFDRIVLYLGTGLFALTVVLATIQVAVRVFDLPTWGTMYWTEPLARFVLIVATYIGAAVATRNNEHVSIKFIQEKIADRSPRLARALRLVNAAIVLVFLVVAFRGTAESAIDDWGTSIGGIDFVTSGVLYLGITVGLFFMLAYTVIEIGSELSWSGTVERDQQLPETEDT